MCAALAGGLLGFLMWNWNPAKIIMGDFGSHFIGGMIVSICYTLDAPWLIPLIAVIYVIEFGSVVIQRYYFKLTHGKRIFKMTPIHHSFEMSGWKEKKIVYVFSAVNLAAGIVAVIITYAGRLR